VSAARDSLAARRVNDNNPWDQFQPFSPSRRNPSMPRRRLLKPMKRLKRIQPMRRPQPFSNIYGPKRRSIT